MELTPIISKYQQRARKAAAKWAALHPTRERRTIEPLIPFPPARIPEGHCQADPGCAFPPLREGKCRQHWRDQIAAGSLSGTCHALLVAEGLVESEMRSAPLYRRRCAK